MKLKYFTLILFFLFLIGLALAQEAGDLDVSDHDILDIEIEDIEIEDIGDDETTEPDDEAGINFFTKNFSGTLGFARGSGAYGTRTNSFLRLQYNQEFTDWLKVVFTGNSQNNEVTLKLRLKECQGTLTGSQCKTNKGDVLPLERQITQRESATNLREAYFDLNLGDYALLSVGNKLVAWGQFEIFSPIDLTSLPTRFGTIGLTFSKLDSRLTQTVAQLNIYPSENSELQFYYFPNLSVDPFLEDLISKEGQKSYKRAAPEEDNKVLIGGGVEMNYQLTKPSDPSQKAARVLFYPSWGIFGITFYSGFDEDPTILGTLMNDPEVANALYIEERETYLTRDVIGLEFSIPSGKWGWKAEIAYIPNNTSSIKLETEDLDQHRDNRTNPETVEIRRTVGQLLDFIRDDNDNKLYYKYDQIFSAFGVDAELDLWKFNLVVFYFQAIFSSEVQKARDLEDEFNRLKGQEIERFGNGGVFPSFNIVKYWNENKETRLGWILGIIPGGVGTSFYFNQEYAESLTIVAALEAIQFFGDESLISSIAGPQYEPAEPISAGLRVGALYKF